ncbi:hypothetical protein GH714_015688 [Hevea brasiliensis]|uniref:ABC-2 type transporter transmembrane domain-containing protein n=1 Tax=Hevea brasiliensis TaxID=3981 RepID=A0A6A6LKY6_HEVBR|nr:hypothetical protein GH714_015688 [Hevea brasiliensis]
MDEPTSGLDARAAAVVMRTVRNTVDTGRTVVCTIHQPSIDIFEAFDELLLMKRGGQVIYAGPLSRHSHKLVEYFEAVPGTDLSVLLRGNQELIKELSTPPPGSKDLYFPTKYSKLYNTMPGLFLETILVILEDHNNSTVSASLCQLSLLFCLVLYSGVKETNCIQKQQDLMNLHGATYAALLFRGAANAITVTYVVAVERTVSLTQKSSWNVAIEAIYFSAKPLYILFFYTQLLGMIGKAEKFLYFAYFILMSFTYFSMDGMMAVAQTPVQQIAAIVMSFFLSLWNLSSGFIIPRPNPGVISTNEIPVKDDKEEDEEMSTSALGMFRAKEEEIERKKMEMKDKVQAQLGRVEEATKRLAEIREELEALTDPLRKEVSMVRKRIDTVNRELKPLGQTCQKKEREYKEAVEAFNEKNKEKAQLVSKLMELVGESERLRLKKLDELSKNIETFR